MNKYEIAALTPTFESYVRILNDSVNLIERTNNLKTLLGRFDDAMECYKWITSAINSGYPAKFSSEDEGFERSLKREINLSIVRIAKNLYNMGAFKIRGLKTPSSKMKRIDKLIVELNLCLQSLKPHFNKSKAESEINELINVSIKLKNTLQ